MGEGKGLPGEGGHLILAMSVLLWFLQSFGFEGGTFGMVSSEESSILGFVGGLLAPLFAPLASAPGRRRWPCSPDW